MDKTFYILHGVMDGSGREMMFESLEDARRAAQRVRGLKRNSEAITICKAANHWSHRYYVCMV